MLILSWIAGYWWWDEISTYCSRFPPRSILTSYATNAFLSLACSQYEYDDNDDLDNAGAMRGTMASVWRPLKMIGWLMRHGQSTQNWSAGPAISFVFEIQFVCWQIEIQNAFELCTKAGTLSSWSICNCLFFFHKYINLSPLSSVFSVFSFSSCTGLFPSHY